MKSTKKLTEEIIKLNQKLDAISSQSRFLIYTTSPKRFLWLNFLSGIVHSMGALISTTILLALFAFLASQVNLIAIISDFFNSILSQINWSQLIFPASQLSPGQL